MSNPILNAALTRSDGREATDNTVQHSKCLSRSTPSAGPPRHVESDPPRRAHAVGRKGKPRTTRSAWFKSLFAGSRKAICVPPVVLNPVQKVVGTNPFLNSVVRVVCGFSVCRCGSVSFVGSLPASAVLTVLYVACLSACAVLSVLSVAPLSDSAVVSVASWSARVYPWLPRQTTNSPGTSNCGPVRQRSIDCRYSACAAARLASSNRE